MKCTWGAHLNERGADADNDLTADVHIQRGSKEFNKDTSNDDYGTYEGWPSSTIGILFNKSAQSYVQA
jgi:hypothetical protein